MQQKDLVSAVASVKRFCAYGAKVATGDPRPSARGFGAVKGVYYALLFCILCAIFINIVP